MKTVLSALQFIERQLALCSVNNPRFESQYLVSAVLSIPQTEVYLHKDRKLSETEREKLSFVLSQRMVHKPLQYIVGSTRFMGLEFVVSPPVLIPRIETEFLVKRIVDDNHPYDSSSPTRKGRNQTQDYKTKHVLDIGTGSGVIAITLAKEFPHWHVDAVDISENILMIAKRNSLKNDARVTFIKSNLFEKIDRKYDIIVSNPPYVSEDEYKTLPVEIACYEPKVALLADEDGFIFYRRIIEQASDFLKPKGKIYFEIGSKQLEGIRKIASDNGFRLIKVDKDYNNRDRVVVLQAKEED